MMGKMKDFEDMKPEHGLNSHIPMLDIYRKMLKAWNASADKYKLTRDDIIRITLIRKLATFKEIGFRDMSEPKIGDISSIQETLKQAQGLVALKRVLPFVAHLLKVLGVDADKIKTDLEMADSLAQQAQELAALPDEFNDYFGERGWIIYESLSLEVAKKAIAVADTGDICLVSKRVGQFSGIK